MNDEKNAKDKIFETVLELLAGGIDPEKMTTRQIAAKAGVNLALVNYYYVSKENLLSEAVGRMMGGIITPLMEDFGGNSAEIRLRKILIKTADAAFEHYKICKVALAAELRQGCANSCAMVLPLLEGIFSGLSRTELDIISLQLMLPFHHVFLEPELYGRMLGADFFDKQQRDQKISEMIKCVLSKGDRTHEY
ncbi:MAG: TetR/AcrR family transcriptional regulator [Clostridiales bacterium]|nr:TetR/AcrR family transcriptional regulator [Clostridiales bacterium]